MTSGLIAIAAGTFGVVALRYAWGVLSSGKEPPPPEKPEFTPGEQMPPDLQLEEQKITLRALSQLWATGEVKTLRFDELSAIWREKRPREEKKERVPKLTREPLIQFYQTKVKGRPFFVGDALQVIMDLLEFLDAHGDCPSVVNLNGSEPERGYDADNYNLLAKVPLYQHSINVACEVISRLGKGPVVPKAVIAALGHDMGKIPAYQAKLYKTGIHPSISLAVVEQYTSAKHLKWYEEIASAIQHHHIQSDAYLDIVLREADQLARRYELTVQIEPKPKEDPPQEVDAAQKQEAITAAAANLAEQVAKAAPAVAAPKADVQEQAAEPPKPAAEPKPAPQPRKAAVESKAKPASEPPPPIALPVEPKRERQRVPRKIVDISEWFDAKQFVKELARTINTTQAGDRYWSALELKGYVYYKPIPFYRLMVAHSKNHPAVAAAGSSEQDRDDFVYTVVMELKKEKDLVATEFLGSDMFAAVFYHNPTPEKSGTKQFLIPFRSAYFGDELLRAETRRSPLMKHTLALVPAFKTGGNK